MPIFLDRRYNLFKTTATDAVRLGQENLKIHQKFGCSLVAQWFDHKRKTTFSFINAPDLQTLQEMQCHLSDGSSSCIIQLEEGLIEAFLNRIDSQNSSEKFTSRSFAFQVPVISAVMVMNIGNRNQVLTEQILIANRVLFGGIKACFEKVIKRNNGNIVKSLRDGCTYSFDSGSQAIKAALQVLNILEKQLRNKAGKELKIKIGIAVRSSGAQNSCLKKTQKLAGELCYIAGTNQIIVSSEVRDLMEMEELKSLMNCTNLKILNRKDEQFILRMIKILKKNYRKNLKIEDICLIMGESRSQLYRKTTEITGLSPLELINGFRLKKAVECMDKQNGSNISQVAYETGFNSLSYFSRLFKNRYGILPSVYMNCKF